MANYLENVIEKLIGDGIITETELEQRIEEAKTKSPVITLQEENAQLWFDNILLQNKAETNEQEIADLWFALLSGGVE